MSLKQQIKQAAYDLGADLVGFGNIERCAEAPIMMSPQGIMPSAKTVVVMAIHHPDACIELGGESHSQEIGPYSVQYLMNSRLDEMSYRLATFIERAGYGAVPIASSNIWRYNQYKDLKAIFAPDISHIYMPVVAGLADMGFNGLALTPEYGARNRFITVITDAELEPDPLIKPGTICDNCMLCRKYCPSDALSKEIDGEKVLRIEGYEYRFANKNLWRCAWGEHFDLDLDLDIPDVVDEQVILDTVAAHGQRCGEMGQCLKFCLPKNLRSFDKQYSKTPMRKYSLVDENIPESRAAVDKLLSRPFAAGADEVLVSSAEDLLAAGIDIQQYLPGAESAVTLMVNTGGQDAGSNFTFGAKYQMDSLCYDLTRGLEALGYRSVMTISAKDNPTEAILKNVPDFEDGSFIANTVISRKAISPQRRGCGSAIRIDSGNAKSSLTQNISELARNCGADLFGVASVERINSLGSQLRDVYEGEPILDARDKSSNFTPWAPEISERKRSVKNADDILDNAKSVIVIGLRMQREVLRWATKPPAEAVGPYCFQTYATTWLNDLIAYRLVQRLRKFGYRCAITTDLTGTASFSASPRGLLPDMFSNRFAGVAAGLGWLSVSGHLVTPEFGIRQRCIAIVTDAPLEQSQLQRADNSGNVCSDCDRHCIQACPSKAFDASREIQLNCDGVVYSYVPVDSRRCDWSNRYALTKHSGFGYLGNPADIEPPEDITAESLGDALALHDPIKKYRPVVAEPCVLSCPLAT